MRLRGEEEEGFSESIYHMFAYMGRREEEERQRLLATTRCFVVCEKLRERGRGGMWREARRGNLETGGEWETMILWLL